MNILGSGYVGGTTIPANLPQSAAFPNKSKDPSSPKELNSSQTAPPFSANPPASADRPSEETLIKPNSTPIEAAKTLNQESISPQKAADILLNSMKNGSTASDVATILMEIATNSQKNTQKVTDILKAMDPDVAAEILDQMESIAGPGKKFTEPVGKFIIHDMDIDHAVALLSSPKISEKNVAAIFESICFILKDFVNVDEATLNQKGFNRQEISELEKNHTVEEVGEAKLKFIKLTQAKKVQDILFGMYKGENPGKAIKVLLRMGDISKSFYGDQILHLKMRCSDKNDMDKIDRALAFDGKLSANEEQLVETLCNYKEGSHVDAKNAMLNTRDPEMVARILTHIYASNRSYDRVNLAMGVEEMCKTNPKFGKGVFTAMCESGETALAAKICRTFTHGETQQLLLEQLSDPVKGLLERYIGHEESLESEKSSRKILPEKQPVVHSNGTKSIKVKKLLSTLLAVLSSFLAGILGLAVGCLIGILISMALPFQFPLILILAIIGTLVGVALSHRARAKAKRSRLARQEKNSNGPSMFLSHFKPLGNGDHGDHGETSPQKNLKAGEPNSNFKPKKSPSVAQESLAPMRHFTAPTVQKSIPQKEDSLLDQITSKWDSAPNEALQMLNQPHVNPGDAAQILTHLMKEGKANVPTIAAQALEEGKMAQILDKMCALEETSIAAQILMAPTSKENWPENLIRGMSPKYATSVLMSSYISPRHAAEILAKICAMEGQTTSVNVEELTGNSLDKLKEIGIDESKINVLRQTKEVGAILIEMAKAKKRQELEKILAHMKHAMTADAYDNQFVSLIIDIGSNSVAQSITNGVNKEYKRITFFNQLDQNEQDLIGEILIGEILIGEIFPQSSSDSTPTVPTPETKLLNSHPDVIGKIFLHAWKLENNEKNDFMQKIILNCNDATKYSAVANALHTMCNYGEIEVVAEILMFWEESSTYAAASLLFQMDPETAVKILQNGKIPSETSAKILEFLYEKMTYDAGDKYAASVINIFEKMCQEINGNKMKVGEILSHFSEKAQREILANEKLLPYSSEISENIKLCRAEMEISAAKIR
ncbi:MAG: hypothetical protein LBI69_03905 [Puniceicoccales bacterium]|jgi:hypothetical protein|nr:hypothetical protein [Puniceicoccales bacterium]